MRLFPARDSPAPPWNLAVQATSCENGMIPRGRGGTTGGKWPHTAKSVSFEKNSVILEDGIFGYFLSRGIRRFHK